MVRRLALAVLTPALVAITLAPAPAGAAAEPRDVRRAATQVQHVTWGSGVQLRSGTRRGLKVTQGSLALKRPKVRTMLGRRYETGTWTSPWVTPGFGATALIPSWEATAPGDSLVRVEVRGRAADGRTGTWDRVADWALANPRLARTTYSGQADDLGRVSVDTWLAASAVSSWQVRVTLLRAPRSALPVRLERVGAVASAVAPAGRTSRVGAAAGTVLDVPAYSQMVHSGHDPQWGGGGEAWCSPTSTAMVLAYHGVHPDTSDIAPGHADAVVDHVARRVYDHGYDGTGNWAFNTAYAATLVAGDSYVTRLADLRAAEGFIAAGVPLVVSIAFGRNQLTGAPISASNGHLLVLAGFEADGDVVVNDPAGATNAAVRRVYDRAEFERLWLSASGGTAYVIRPS